MIVELIEDFVKLALIVTSLYFVLGETVRRMHPTWSEPLGKRRLTTLWVLVFAASAVKLTEDVLGGESGPIDRAILLFIHGHFPHSLIGFFEAVTLTGSSWFLFPFAAVTTIALLWAKHRFEALLVAMSVISAAMVIYVIKTVVGRLRPALWDTEWYWGSAFPADIRSPSRHSLLPPRYARAASGRRRTISRCRWRAYGQRWSPFHGWCWVCTGQLTYWSPYASARFCLWQ